MCAAVVEKQKQKQITRDNTVPGAEHWRSFAAAPESFDPNMVWSYTRKQVDDKGSKIYLLASSA